MAMSEFYGPRDEATSIATIRRALDLGIDLLDTADAYGPFTNEQLVGRAIRDHRDQVVIASKFGYLRSESGAFLGIDCRPKSVRGACDASLRRLGVRVLDVYFQHCLDPLTPVEETVGAMADLIKVGKIRFIGLCNATADVIRRANAVHPIAALQIEYSLWQRDAEEVILPLCRSLGIGVVAYRPLARGLLAGRFDSLDEVDSRDQRGSTEDFAPMRFSARRRRVHALRRIAREKGCTVAQLAISWLLHRCPGIVPIPGSTRPETVEENAGATFVHLSPAECGLVEAMSPASHVNEAHKSSRDPPRVAPDVEE